MWHVTKLAVVCFSWGFQQLWQQVMCIPTWPEHKNPGFMSSSRRNGGLEGVPDRFCTVYLNPNPTWTIWSNSSSRVWVGVQAGIDRWMEGQRQGWFQVRPWWLNTGNKQQIKNLKEFLGHELAFLCPTLTQYLDYDYYYAIFSSWLAFHSLILLLFFFNSIIFWKAFISWKSYMVHFNSPNIWQG